MRFTAVSPRAVLRPETDVGLAKASDLSGRDAKVWKRSALVSAAVGIVLGCIAGLAAAAGNIDSLALLLPIALLFLVFAAAIWMMLRTRNRQLGANP